MRGDALSHDVYGSAPPASPIVLSVPHAGRDYPLALRSALRVPVAGLRALEDRHVDTLAFAARGGESMIVQRRARAWIDLNRAEHERDPMIDHGAPAHARGQPSAKVRAGLGLVPRRVPSVGELWRHRFEGDDVAARIARDHRPYHAALGDMLAAARARFGAALLLDVHSMPSLGPRGPRLVLGDRFGRTAIARQLALIEAIAGGAGLRTALNAPYAGGHILERHAAPAGGIHAIQLEIDRTLYLDAALDGPGDGFAATAALLRRIVSALADDLVARATPLAAE